MEYRDYFTRKYMLAYTHALSWDDTYTLLFRLQHNRWKLPYYKGLVFSKTVFVEATWWRKYTENMIVSHCKAMLDKGGWK